MKRSNTLSPTRTAIASTLIVASFLSAFILSRAANRTELVWSASKLLLPGEIIDVGNVALRRVSITGITNLYISEDENIFHNGVLREVRPGELIPKSTLSQDRAILKKSQVPISVQISDSPAGLMSGDLVNVYHVADLHTSEIISPPTLVLAHARVLGTDNKNQNLGGNISLTLSIETRAILTLLKATESGRLVLVRLND